MTERAAALILLTNYLITNRPGTAFGDEIEVDDDSKRCINARSIRGADVIDDDHLLFEIQGRRIFLNVLQSTCTGLSRDRRFSYDTYTRSLCASDRIRILRQSGDDFFEGKACKLGRFRPITYDELKLYLQERTVKPEPQRPDPPDVEDVTEE